MAEVETTTAASPQTAGTETTEFASLLKKEFRPLTERKQQDVENAVRTLAEQALKDSGVISEDAVQTIKAILAEIDSKMSQQINLILHHAKFQELESAWRGLHHLVNHTETSEQLKIRVMNISKEDLRSTLRKHAGAAWDQSPIFKKIYNQEYSMFGGQPYGCLIGDYYFDHNTPDVKLLEELAKNAAAAHVPFIAGTSPEVFQMESWRQLGNPVSLTGIFQTAEYAPWRSLRESEDSRYIGLTLPRFLARQPYGAKTNPVEGFDFEEDMTGADPNRYTWANAAYAMAVNINRSFALYGWCSSIRGVESGGTVEGLPTHTFLTDDGGIEMTCPTEIAVDDRRLAELSDNGFISLTHKKNSDLAVFFDAPSLHKPPEYNNHDATANAKLGAKLPYLFAVSRFAHYLKCIVRDKLGSFKEREDMQRWLQDWIIQYVDGDPVHSGPQTKAEKPLAGARVEVNAVEGNPGYYTAKFYLRPHFQLEGLTVDLSLVAKLPSVAGG